MIAMAGLARLQRGAVNQDRAFTVHPRWTLAEARC
jgi:tRNA A37 threonylcarbamoyltransferase TsaD